MTCKNINCADYKECHDDRRRVLEALMNNTLKLQTAYRVCERSYKQNHSWAERAGIDYDHRPFWKVDNEHKEKQRQN